MKLDQLGIINSMCGHDYTEMVRDLEQIRQELGGESIDVRLCIDIDNTVPSWIIRSGDASFDQRHSMFCGASSVQIDTVPRDLIEDLINQCLDQAYESI